MRTLKNYLMSRDFSTTVCAYNIGSSVDSASFTAFSKSFLSICAGCGIKNCSGTLFSSSITSFGAEAFIVNENFPVFTFSFPIASIESCMYLRKFFTLFSTVFFFACNRLISLSSIVAYRKIRLFGRNPFEFSKFQFFTQIVIWTIRKSIFFIHRKDSIIKTM